MDGNVRIGSSPRDQRTGGEGQKSKETDGASNRTANSTAAGSLAHGLSRYLAAGAAGAGAGTWMIRVGCVGR